MPPTWNTHHNKHDTDVPECVWMEAKIPFLKGSACKSVVSGEVFVWRRQGGPKSVGKLAGFS